MNGDKEKRGGLSGVADRHPRIFVYLSDDLIAMYAILAILVGGASDHALEEF